MNMMAAGIGLLSVLQQYKPVKNCSNTKNKSKNQQVRLSNCYISLYEAL